jgi:hypothetical protein
MNAPITVDPDVYYTETIPEAFNRTLELQPRESASELRVFEDMLAVNATIHVEVRSENVRHYFLNIAAGRMTAGDSPSHEPFLTVVLDPQSLAQVARETGNSITALLGAVAGLGADMKLTGKRVRDLAEVSGLIRFEVAGDEGFSVLTGFGVESLQREADATIRMDFASYRALREGRLDPQAAFLEDAIHTEGDMQKVMQIALAAVAPD